MEIEPRSGITVAELIDMLTEHPGDAVVELALIAPINPEDADITVDRYYIDGLLPWAETDDDDDPGSVWLVGGEDDDVDTFLDALENNVE